MTSEQSLRGQYNSLLKVQQAALDRLHEGVVVFGSDGRLQLSNAAFAAMWGLQTEALEQGIDFERFSDACRPLFHEQQVWGLIKARITDPSPQSRQEFRGEMRRSDGSIVFYLTRPLPNGATLVAFLDVTASRRVEDALRERAEALETADRLKTEFVQNVSKQLRDPLQTIAGYSELLAARVAGPLNDRQQDQVSTIVAASGQLGKLIDNVLDLALVEAGDVALDLSEVDILSALKEAAGAASSAKATEVPIRVEAVADIGTLRADEKRIRQILFNLVTNALRFTERGDEIIVGAERVEGMVRLWVSDTGRGMPYDAQANAFDNFVSGDKRGAGLGLALVRSFAELHGGWVALQSEPGAGTTVNVYLPSQEARQLVAAE
jgi:signal transduction histidine kinase